MAVLQEISVPLLAVNDTSLTVVEIPLRNGAKIKRGDAVLVFETSKTTYQVEADVDGFVQYLCELGKDYEVNDVVARIVSEIKEVSEHSPPAHGAVNPATSIPDATVGVPSWTGETLFSTAAESLITLNRLDKALFRGRDLVTKYDVDAFLVGEKGGTTEMTSRNVQSSRQSKSSPPVDMQKVVIEKLATSKKREIEYLSEVQGAGLTSTINTIIETEGIFSHINKSLQYFKGSLLPVIIYETSRLLQKYPLLNAYYAGDAVAVYKDVNLGFAIDIDKGLKVLKVPNANTSSIQNIEQRILELSTRYLDDSLSLDDLVDISFTITDLSGENVAFFRPLVNMMNSAILGVSAIDEKLNRCTLSVTFDHRVTEGKAVARFLNELKGRLESYRQQDLNDRIISISCFKCYKTLSEDLSDTGFVKCITPEGKEGYICQSCIKGF